MKYPEPPLPSVSSEHRPQEPREMEGNEDLIESSPLRRDSSQRTGCCTDYNECLGNKMNKIAVDSQTEN